MPTSRLFRAGSQFASMGLIELLITAATFSSLGVVLPRMVEELHWSWSEAGLGFTILGAACGGSSLLPSWLIRVVGVRVTLMMGVIGLAFGLYLLHGTETILRYFTAAAICGVSFQLMAWIPATFVITRLFERRSLALGLYATIGGFGNVVGPWMVLAVLGAPGHGWRDYWLYQSVGMFVIGMAAAAIIGMDRRFARPARLEFAEAEAAARPDDASPAPVPAGQRLAAFRTREDWSQRDALHTPQFYIIVAAYFANLLAMVTVTGLGVSHLVERGVSTPTAAAMLSLEALVAVLFRAGSGWLGDHIDPRFLISASLGCTAIGCAFLAGVDTQPWLLFYAVGTGIGFGTTQLCCTVLLLNYFGQRYNLELFSTMCLIGTASAAGPLIGGMIRDATGSFVMVFVLLAVVAAAIGAATLLMRPPSRAAAPKPFPAPATDLRG